jgi:hypothetical protein
MKFQTQMRACQEAQRSRKRWCITSTGEQLMSIRNELSNVSSSEDEKESEAV